MLFLSIVECVAAGTALGQANSKPGRNNPYAPSPSITTAVQPASTPVLLDSGDRPVTEPVPVTKPPQPPAKVAFIAKLGPGSTSPDTATQRSDTPQLAVTSPGIKTPASTASAPVSPPKTPSVSPATAIYKLGAGDIVYINIRNAGLKGGLYDVRNDGTIDFPLAGENVRAAGRTVDELGSFLRSSIKLFTDPQVELKVREFNSHRITVTGLVQTPGEISLQREAMPIFAVRAQSGATPQATRVQITRANSAQPETYSLAFAKNDDILVFAGDKVAFLGGN